MMPIKLVILDMAGTTVKDDHQVEKCFAQAARETGLIVSEQTILAVQGWSKRFVFEVLWGEQLGVGHPGLKEHVDRSYTAFREILENHYLTYGAQPTDHCLETLAWLKKQGIMVALTTGFYRKVTDIILEKLGWLDMLNRNYRGRKGSLIDFSIAGDEVPNGRPAPDMILQAMSVLGIDDPKQVINIGDTPSDLESGKRADVFLSLGVTNGTHVRSQLEKHPNDGLLNSLAGLPILLETIPAAVSR
jgi:phosphonatase-like hydrolase